jgi:hypothetical protein
MKRLILALSLVTAGVATPASAQAIRSYGHHHVGARHAHVHKCWCAPYVIGFRAHHRPAHDRGEEVLIQQSIDDANTRARDDSDQMRNNANQ